MPQKSPFEFGRELTSQELVDRKEELDTVVRTMEGGGRLFLIGPRRFGKTSILRAATELAESAGTVVIRHDAEAYPTLRLLAEAIVAEAASRLSTSAEKAGKKVRGFFGALRPEIGYNPLDGSFSASLNSGTPKQETKLLATVLDGLDQMAADSGRTVAVVIDEFQHVIQSGSPAGGIAAERQLRAAVQRHENVSYIFAGSKTKMLAEMTGDSSRPFYRLGSRLFIGPIPREDFAPFLLQGFRDSGYHADDVAVQTILDLAEDVPYNVQRLAHECWNDLRDKNGNTLVAQDVARILNRIVSRDDPFYTQTWNRLKKTQQKALLAMIESNGIGLYSSATVRKYDLPLASMQTALQALVRIGVAREEETQGSVRLKLEDPFFAVWVRLFVPPF
jgi:AAA+ ATPase superfamily predicted ATPase